MRNIGRNIKTIRQSKGMTQDAMAAALFVTRQTVSNYENGRSHPDLDTLLRISEILETDINAIIYGPPVPQSKKDSYKWLILSGGILAAITVSYAALSAIFTKDSFFGYQHAIRLVNQLTLFPVMLFALGWFLMHCLSVAGNLQQLRSEKIRPLRIIAMVVLVLLAIIPVPMVIFSIVAAYRSYVYAFVSMSFPYIPVYRESFKVILFMIGKIPFVYIIFGSIAWLLGLPRVKK